MAVEHPQGNENLFLSTPSPPGWRRWAARCVAVLSGLYLLLTLGLWALLRAGDVCWPATLLMFSPRWLLAIPLALLLPAAALLRRRSLGLLLLTLALIVGPIMGFCVPWQRFRFDTPHGPRLRVLTCNMHYQESQPVILEHLLATTQPDVVAVQEWREASPSAYFPKSEWHTHEASNLFLACRGPIRPATRIGDDSMDATGSVMRYELETSAGVITFFSLHLASPRKGLYEVIHEPRTGAADLREGSARRAEQFENLSLEVEDVSGPLILAGDFNTPPESVLFRDVWGRYTDAFSSAGWGWGYTFLGDRTTVRIDHILAGPGWRCQRCWVGPNIGSPHRPVLADLVWTGAPPER
ncbi:MAG TPA: endonuclease/exonuclease/phosphatase family protein [Gemmataceae bacterium]